jgi:two-component system, NtrC family, response regulator AtoC
VARSSINVMLVGETGAGKEVMARLLHERSGRQGPLVAINCAAFSEGLFESELFGHERGAFTGAHLAKPGQLEAADGGTVFLDEITELAAPLQAKLLRVIETRRVTRVGGLKERAIDVRFIAASNRDLEQAVVQGVFRQDLYYRLCAVTLHIPPLRERVGEIPALATRFIADFARREKRPEPLLSPAALTLLEKHPWKGNVRELRNVIERAVVVCDGPRIDPDHLALEKSSVVVAQFQPQSGAAPPLPLGSPAASERDRMIDALARHAWNQSLAAASLGMPRRTFCRRMKEYGIPGPRTP